MESRNSPITYFRRWRGRTDDRRSRAHLFVADHFLLMYRRPRRFRMRNEMASRNLSSVIYDAPCRTGVPIVTTNTPIETHALSILGPRPSETIHLNCCFFSFGSLCFRFIVLRSSPPPPLLFSCLIVLQRAFNRGSSDVI